MGQLKTSWDAHSCFVFVVDQRRHSGHLVLWALCVCSTAPPAASSKTLWGFAFSELHQLLAKSSGDAASCSRMATGMPELGSKISLISKADIRYEGRLFTVDPQECTIALASVRSFGTEDRETQFPVPAQNQVYDYILFRGSDIKDIRVVNNVAHAQPLNDPAIMQLSVPPSLGAQQFQNHPVLGHLGPQMPQFGGHYGGMTVGGLVPGMARGGAAAGASSKPTSVLDFIGGGSRCTTPASVGSRKSPTNDQGVQAGGHKDKKMVKPIQPPGQRSHHQRKNSRERDGQGYKNNQQQQQNRQPMNRQHQNNTRDGGYHHQNQMQSGGYQYYQNNQRPQQQSGNNTNSWTNRGPMRQRGRPRGNSGSTYKGQPNQQQGNNKNKTLKFENDYDFEQANTEFEELRSQLSKVKLEEGEGSAIPSSTPQVLSSLTNLATNTTATPTKCEVNGASNLDTKKDDSGNETGAGEPEHEEENEVFYDKAKSFFDKISCEAVERAKGKSQRTDWRTERKLNSETFGVAATRRGNFRGRGSYRGMVYRGGYRGGYRQNNNSQRRDNSATPAASQGNREQKPTTPLETSTAVETVIDEPATAVN